MKIRSAHPTVTKVLTGIQGFDEIGWDLPSLERQAQT
jgi:hypothetical protein